MKMLKIGLLAAVAAMCASSAMAQGYVALGAGPSHYNLDCSGMTSCDNNDTAFKVVGGYTLGKGFSAELGYASFGKARASDPSVSANLKGDGLTLGAAYQYQFNRDWGAAGHLGLARMKTTMSGTVNGVGSASLSETHTAPYYGLAVNYMLGKSWKVEGGVDFSKVESSGEKANVRAITFGAGYAF